MKTRLIVFLILFPGCLWVLEWVARWAMDSPETRTFLAPAISSAALGMIGPVAVQRSDDLSSLNRKRDATVSFYGLLALVIGVILWFLCLAINIKKSIPAEIAGLMGPDGWQFALAMFMYVVATLLTLFKEGA